MALLITRKNYDMLKNLLRRVVWNLDYNGIEDLLWLIYITISDTVSASVPVECDP